MHRLRQPSSERSGVSGGGFWRRCDPFEARHSSLEYSLLLPTPPGPCSCSAGSSEHPHPLGHSVRMLAARSVSSHKGLDAATQSWLRGKIMLKASHLKEIMKILHHPISSGQICFLKKEKKKKATFKCGVVVFLPGILRTVRNTWSGEHQLKTCRTPEQGWASTGV